MTQPSFDAREGSGDPETDPAAMGEVSAANPDADGGSVVERGDVDRDGAELAEGHPS